MSFLKRDFSASTMNILQKRLPVSLSVTQRGMLAKVLPFVSVAGLLWLINRVLSAIALNNWRLKRSGKTWVFNGTEELAVVTGGSAGFGRLITKGRWYACSSFATADSYQGWRQR